MSVQARPGLCQSVRPQSHGGLDPTMLSDLSLRCQVAEGADRDIDALIWSQVGWTDGGDDDRAWRWQWPRSPKAVVNGRTMAEAIDLFPHDLSGAAQAWSVPLLTADLSAAITLLGEPERPFVFTIMTDYGGLKRVRVYDDKMGMLQRDAETLPLATCAAAMAALAGEWK